MHMSLETYWVQTDGATYNAPWKHDGLMPGEPETGSHLYEVLYVYDPKLTHVHCGQEKEGRHRWVALFPMTDSSTPYPKPPSTPGDHVNAGTYIPKDEYIDFFPQPGVPKDPGTPPAPHEDTITFPHPGPSIGEKLDDLGDVFFDPPGLEFPELDTDQSDKDDDEPGAVIGGMPKIPTIGDKVSARFPPFGGTDDDKPPPTGPDIEIGDVLNPVPNNETGLDFPSFIPGRPVHDNPDHEGSLTYPGSRLGGGVPNMTSGKGTLDFPTIRVGHPVPGTSPNADGGLDYPTPPSEPDKQVDKSPRIDYGPLPPVVDPNTGTISYPHPPKTGPKAFPPDIPVNDTSLNFPTPVPKDPRIDDETSLLFDGVTTPTGYKFGTPFQFGDLGRKPDALAEPGDPFVQQFNRTDIPPSDRPPPTVKVDIPLDNTHVLTLQELSVPGVVHRPQHFDDNSIDCRGWRKPDQATIDRCKRDTPVVIRTEAWGHQNQTGGFNYTHRPGGTDQRYGPVGTAKGGIIFTPPEKDVPRIRDDSLPDGVTVTNPVYVLFPPGVRLGWGIPSTDSGALKDNSFSFEYDESTPKIVIRDENEGVTTDIGSIGNDIETCLAGSGFICKDDTDGNKYRINTSNGTLQATVVP